MLPHWTSQIQIRGRHEMNAPNPGPIWKCHELVFLVGLCMIGWMKRSSFPCFVQTSFPTGMWFGLLPRSTGEMKAFWGVFARSGIPLYLLICSVSENTIHEIKRLFSRPAKIKSCVFGSGFSYMYIYLNHSLWILNPTNILHKHTSWVILGLGCVVAWLA